jgi:hypothetical protein
MLTHMRDKFLGIGFCVVFLLLFIRPIDGDGDFYHHLNVGREIVMTHKLPRVDTLTHTAAGRPFVGNGWLSGVVFYLIYASVGAIGINILNYALAAATFFLLFWYLHRCLRVVWRSTLLSLLIVAPVVATRWPYRPEMFMYIFLFGLFLVDYYQTAKPWLSILFPVLTLLLVTFYGAGFPLVTGILSLLIFFRAIKQKKYPQHWLYYVSIIACFPVALFLNGYGLKSIGFIQFYSKWTFLWGDWVGLWDIILHPEMGFTPQIVIMYCLFTAYVIFLALYSYKYLKRYALFSILALMVFFPFVAVRLRTFGALLSAPFIALLLSHVKSRWVLWFSFALALGVSVWFIVTNPPRVGESSDVFPPRLIEFMKIKKLSGNVFNTPRIGAFLSYYLYPQIRTFADTRDDLFIGTGVLKAEQAFLSANASISYLTRKYNIDIVIVNQYDGNSFRDLIYDPQWALIYLADNYLIFVPRSIAVDKNLQIFGEIDPYSPTGIKTAL